jgi:predicted TIM-barrel fold metal-dependent hydrolase
MTADDTPIRIDSHAHVFRRDLPLVAGYRHAPQRDALLPELLGLFDQHGITHGVLTAPSFLGTDNAFLLSALAAAPGRLRGTVIVDATIGRAALEAMDRMGAVGVRFNMLRRTDLPDLRTAQWRRVLEAIATLDWHVEIYVEGPRLPVLLAPALEVGAKVVVDHFGSPDPQLRLDCPGFRDLLAAVSAGRTWVKLSAPYRLGGADARPYARALLDAGGAGQLVWASDWPWTQYSEGLTYARTLDWLREWVPDAVMRARILGATPRALFRFATDAPAPGPAATPGDAVH